jgi:hypothetical protein
MTRPPDTRLDWIRITSRHEDAKMLFRFDWRTMQIELMTRRKLRGEWQRIFDVVPLLSSLPSDLAGSIQAMIAAYPCSVPLSSRAGTAILTPRR